MNQPLSTLGAIQEAGGWSRDVDSPAAWLTIYEANMSERKTAEQRAAELVTTRHWPTGEELCLFGDPVGNLHLDSCRASLASALALHAEEALRPPIPGGISAERLAETRRILNHVSETHFDYFAHMEGVSHDTSTCVYCSLRDIHTHIDHLSAYLRIVATDDGLDAQDALWRLGFEAGKKACVEAAEKELLGWQLRELVDAKRSTVAAVKAVEVP